MWVRAATMLCVYFFVFVPFTNTHTHTNSSFVLCYSLSFVSTLKYFSFLFLKFKQSSRRLCTSPLLDVEKSESGQKIYIKCLCNTPGSRKKRRRKKNITENGILYTPSHTFYFINNNECSIYFSFYIYIYRENCVHSFHT